MARASRLNALGNVSGAGAPQEPAQPGRRGCFGRAARVGIACLLHLVVVASASAVEGLPGWGTNLVVSQRLARIAERPVVVYFTASWCGPCKLMARTTLGERSVEAALERFSRVMIDIDAQPGVAAAHGVTAVPAFLLLDVEGDALLRSSGYMDTNRFLAWLGEARTEFAAAIVRRRQLEEEKAAILSAMNGADASQARGAMQRLFDLAARREQSALDFAVGQLKQAASRQPELLVDGLLHTNLAARIHVANALRGAVRRELEFDPWEEVDVRARQVQAVRSQLRPVSP